MQDTALSKQVEEEKFLGFDFEIKGKEIIAEEPEKLIIYNDGSGLTGDFSEEDNYFNDDMKRADRELDNILRGI
jgi:hypothetical protein